MPGTITDATRSGTTDSTLGFFGIPTAPPPPPLSPPTLNQAPTVSSTPRAGQGVALTQGGVLPASAAATGLRMLTADPASPLIGEFWYRTDTSQLCVRHDAATTKRVTLA